MSDQTKQAVATFHDAYLAAYGSKPTWGAKQVSMIKRLVKLHGLEEVERRVRVLFGDPPGWLKPPYTVNTLVGCFDSLVVPARESRASSGELDGDDLRAFADFLDEESRR